MALFCFSPRLSSVHTACPLPLLSAVNNALLSPAHHPGFVCSQKGRQQRTGMDFPVYVASDVRGVKLNLAVPYHPHTASIERFLHTTSLTFDAVAEQLQLGSLAPFAAAYIYSDVHCQWDPLVSRAQLSPCCQIYVFRDDAKAEAVGAIPNPLRPSYFFALRAATTQDERSWASDASPGPRPPAHSSFHAAFSTPIRLASSRWVLPSSHSPARSPAVAAAAAASTATRTQPTRRRFAVSPLSPQPPAHAHDIRVTHPLHLDKGTLTEACNAEATAAAHPRKPAPPSASSHRFYRSIISPPAEREARPHRPPDVLVPPRTTTATNTAAAAGRLSLPPPWPVPSASASMRQHTPLSRHASSSSFGRADVHTPRSWYEPSQHAHAHAHTADEFGGRVTDPRRPSALSKTGSAHSSGAPRAMWGGHASRRPSGSAAASPEYARAGSGRSGSILREERERVEARMHMGMDELRASLQEEDRQLRRTLSGTPRHPRSPLYTASQR